MTLEHSPKITSVNTINKNKISTDAKIQWGESLCKLSDSNQILHFKLYKQDSK